MASSSAPVVDRKILLPFILVTSLFALWGFANDVTNPLVAVFKDVFVISNAQSSWVQMAFYGGYATMALPAALFIRRFSYKKGILVGLGLYATGALLSIPAAAGANFNLFIVALYVLTFGLAFLETTANPYVLSMGSPETATRRLNLAQAFNPMGSLTGMFVAMSVILSNIQVEDFKNDIGAFYAEQVPATEQKQEPEVLPFLKAPDRELVRDPAAKAYVERVVSAQTQAAEVISEAQEKVGRLGEQGAGELTAIQGVARELQSLSNEVGGAEGDPSSLGGKVVANALVDFKGGAIKDYQGMTHAELQKKDLKIVSLPYMIIGFIVLGVLVIFLVTKMPDTTPPGDDHDIHFGRTVKRLLTNPRYVGGVIAQTFYVGAQIMCWTFIIQYAENELGIDKATAQNHNILAMMIFLTSRFICTFFLKYISPGRLLFALSVGGLAFTLGAIHLEGMAGLYSLIAISACMSLMFPTIYGLALDGMGEDAKLGSAGLIFAIVGGAVMPRLQGGILDLDGFMGTTATRGSFYLPALCFVVIAAYGLMTFGKKAKVAAGA